MKYRKMPFNQDKLSILGFGLMRLPVDSNNVIIEDKAMELMQVALDKGVNYFDTAWPYHNEQSEPLLGRFLQKIDRSKIYVATKLPTWLTKTRQDMDEYLDKQLVKLQTDYIDYYLLHALNKKLWLELKKAGVIEFLEKAKADGKIRHIGFSFHDKYPAFKHIIDAYPWEFCQIQHNFFDTKHEAGKLGLEYAASKNIGIVIMEPLLGGKLVGNIPAEAEKIWQKSDYKWNPVERALRFVWNYPGVQVTLSGMSNLEQMNENIAIASRAKENELSDKELMLYNKVRRVYLTKMAVRCTGCGYCMPCPSKVGIPYALGIYNNAHMFGDKKRHQFEYKFFVPDPHKADKCTACGACLPKCPQKIDIPKELAAVTEYFKEEK
jgi:hypothetical protein